MARQHVQAREEELRSRAPDASVEYRCLSQEDVAAGDHPGRTAAEHVVVSPVGLGIEDLAWATYVLRRAEKLDVGTTQRLWNEPVWR